MRELGLFEKDDAGVFAGVIKTFAFTASLRIVPVTIVTGAGGPSHEVFVNDAIVGEARPAGFSFGPSTFKVRLDDPCLPGPLEGLLQPSGSGDGYSFTWVRGIGRPSGLGVVKP